MATSRPARLPYRRLREAGTERREGTTLTRLPQRSASVAYRTWEALGSEVHLGAFALRPWRINVHHADLIGFGCLLQCGSLR
jgi:hypothetical protein